MNRRLGLCLYITLQSALVLNHDAKAESASLMRDPTQPAIQEPVAAELKPDQKEIVYTLQSIVISPTRRIALINDKYVAVGDRLDEDTVEMINKNFVVLTRPGQKRTLYLFDLSSWE